jgi:hypothetical protein
MSRAPEPSSLYPDEEELAQCVLGKKARQWSNIAPTLEREGLPRIDPLTGAGSGQRYAPSLTVVTVFAKITCLQAPTGRSHGEASPAVRCTWL